MALWTNAFPPGLAWPAIAPAGKTATQADVEKGDVRAGSGLGQFLPAMANALAGLFARLA